MQSMASGVVIVELPCWVLNLINHILVPVIYSSLVQVQPCLFTHIVKLELRMLFLIMVLCVGCAHVRMCTGDYTGQRESLIP